MVDLLREALGQRARDLVAATFTHGDKFTQDRDYRRPTASVGKAYLVSRLQALLQTGRLKLPRTAETDALARELQDTPPQMRGSRYVQLPWRECEDRSGASTAEVGLPDQHPCSCSVALAWGVAHRHAG